MNTNQHTHTQYENGEAHQGKQQQAGARINSTRNGLILRKLITLHIYVYTKRWFLVHNCTRLSTLEMLFRLNFKENEKKNNLTKKVINEIEDEGKKTVVDLVQG